MKVVLQKLKIDIDFIEKVFFCLGTYKAINFDRDISKVDMNF